MATFMSLVMSLVETIKTHEFATDLLPVWLASFAVGALVAVPTAILVGPSAQRLVGYLTRKAEPSESCFQRR
jgi:integral membrane sensor domain MASE1